MNVQFRHTPLGRRYAGDLQGLVDVQFKLIAELSDILSEIEDAAGDDDRTIRHGGHVDGTHTAYAERNIARLEAMLAASREAA